MIKGVRVRGMGPTLSYLDTLEVPIIDNTPNEEDLKDSMAEAMVKYPNAPAVLVRHHGVYVWGKALIALHPLSHSNEKTFYHRQGADWEKAKTQAEVRFLYSIIEVFFLLLSHENIFHKSVLIISLKSESRWGVPDFQQSKRNHR